MKLYWMNNILLIICIYITQQTGVDGEIFLRLDSTAYIPYLQQFGGYASTTIKHFEIPRETVFASFKFKKIEDYSNSENGSCRPQNVSITLKFGSFPLIVTPETKFPPSFKNISRLRQFNARLPANGNETYINLTIPEPGHYFMMAFLTNGTNTNNCYVHLRTNLYLAQKSFIEISEKISYNINLEQFRPVTFKFFVPREIRHASIIFTNITSPNVTRFWRISVCSRRPPSRDKKATFMGRNSGACFNVPFATEEENWHFIEFGYTNLDNWLSRINTTFHFYLKYYHQKNEPKFFHTGKIQHVTTYRQLNLFRESRNSSIGFVYRFYPNNTVSVSSQEVIVLKFEVKENIDIGSSLHFSLLSPMKENKTLVGCLDWGSPALPTHSGSCKHEHGVTTAPLFLNKSIKTDSATVPYPEAGVWYASFRLFCDACSPCVCPRRCQNLINDCVKKCKKDDSRCINYNYSCKKNITSKEGCSGCNCEGRYKHQEALCNLSVVFDVSATACADSCGPSGLCRIMIADGMSFGSCTCFRGSKGWSCWETTVEQPPSATVTELLLLVLSNLLFLPAVFVAYRRRYYVESVAYFCVFFFSTFYHACDSDTVNKNINFCITRWDALQFADFYSAVTATWITLIAIADMPDPWSGIFYVLGALVFAFLLSINPIAVWANATPPVIGVTLIAASWFFKWWKMGTSFVEKKYIFIYVPLGMGTVSLGLLFFGILVTAENYIYFHSLWHVIMAGAIILALPRRGTFRKELRNRVSSDELT